MTAAICKALGHARCSLIKCRRCLLSAAILIGSTEKVKQQLVHKDKVPGIKAFLNEAMFHTCAKEGRVQFRDRMNYPKKMQYVATKNHCHSTHYNL